MLTFSDFALCRRAGRLPKCLVMAPTRELAKQVEKEFMESAPSKHPGAMSAMSIPPAFKTTVLDVPLQKASLSCIAQTF